MSPAIALRSFDIFLRRRPDAYMAAMLSSAALFLLFVESAWGATVARVLSWSVIFIIGAVHHSAETSPAAKKRCYFLTIVALGIALFATFARD